MDERDEQIAELKRMLEAQGKQLAQTLELLESLEFESVELAEAASQDGRIPDHPTSRDCVAL